MREMKDSGNKWIGLIPKTWSVERIKTIFSERSELSEDGSETLLSVSEYYGVANRAEKVEDGEYVSRAESLVGYKKCYKGDLVSNIMLAWKGSMGVTELDGIVSPAYCVYKPSKSVYPRYYHYLFRTSLYTSIFRLYSKGIIDSRLRLYSPYFFDIKAIIPSYAEQQRIAEFLDRKCAEVDEMIALQEQIIEELKAYKQSVITEAVTKGLNPAAPMRDSGIEWIGSIPEYWEVCRIKNIATGFSNGTSVTQLADEDSQYAVTRIETISTGKINYDKVGYVPFFEGINKYLLVKGDILISNINSLERVGNSAMYMGEQTLYHGMNLLRVHTNERMFATYLHYYLRSKAFLEQMKSCCNHAINQVSVSSSTLKNLYIVLPNLTEQQAIADYLDEKCADIDSLIQTKQSKIDSLKEYKKSIIYEYVTGKREVE